MSLPQVSPPRANRNPRAHPISLLAQDGPVLRMEFGYSGQGVHVYKHEDLYSAEEQAQVKGQHPRAGASARSFYVITFCVNLRSLRILHFKPDVSGL